MHTSGGLKYAQGGGTDTHTRVVGRRTAQGGWLRNSHLFYRQTDSGYKEMVPTAINSPQYQHIHIVFGGTLWEIPATIFEHCNPLSWIHQQESKKTFWSTLELFPSLYWTINCSQQRHQTTGKNTKKRNYSMCKSLREGLKNQINYFRGIFPEGGNPTPPLRKLIFFFQNFLSGLKCCTCCEMDSVWYGKFIWVFFDTFTKVRTCGRGQDPGRISRGGGGHNGEKNLLLFFMFQSILNILRAS